MNTTITVIGILAVALILFLAIRYIVKEKKKGNKCIGCPYAESCGRFRQGENCDN